MTATNCPRCGRIFTPRTASICDACVKAEAEKFEEVRTFVKQNPNTPIGEVSTACDVSVKRILQYIKDGKLEASSAMEGLVVCSACGKPLLIGRMCDPCAQKAASGFLGNNKAASSPRASTPSGSNTRIVRK